MYKHETILSRIGYLLLLSCPLLSYASLRTMFIVHKKRKHAYVSNNLFLHWHPPTHPQHRTTPVTACMAMVLLGGFSIVPFHSLWRVWLLFGRHIITELCRSDLQLNSMATCLPCMAFIARVSPAWWIVMDSPLGLLANSWTLKARQKSVYDDHQYNIGDTTLLSLIHFTC